MHVSKQCASNLKVWVRLIIECALQSGKYGIQIYACTRSHTHARAHTHTHTHTHTHSHIHDKLITQLGTHVIARKRLVSAHGLALSAPGAPVRRPMILFKLQHLGMQARLSFFPFWANKTIALVLYPISKFQQVQWSVACSKLTNTIDKRIKTC